MFRSLLQCLVYFDIFSYPLTENEIFSYCNIEKPDRTRGLKILKQLTDLGIINFHTGYYYLKHDPSIVARRLNDNRVASERLKTAEKYSFIISCFPFVRAVFISGSLSKNVMKPDDDIDFFIITEPGRLWISRAMLTLFKKLFLANSHRNFCINYFIDSDSLEIPDKNIYTATEIAFLLPAYNYDLYRQFLRSNDWYHSEYPNLQLREEKISVHPWRIKYLIEKLFRNSFGEWFDKRCHAFFSAYFRRKYFWLDDNTFSQNIRSKRNVSKHHPYSFQSLVLHLYEKKRTYFESSAEIALMSIS
ncbi:MAG TPA: hypothetical protein VHI78_03050 [Bacteroidales bacterium]|nr:hypothetical protein [Bacteroidales bacterium]